MPHIKPERVGAWPGFRGHAVELQVALVWWGRNTCGGLMYTAGSLLILQAQDLHDLEVHSLLLAILTGIKCQLRLTTEKLVT